MTVDEVKALVEDVRQAAINRDDNASAHIREDELLQDVLTYLASTGNELAQEAIKVYEIEYRRWYS